MDKSKVQSTQISYEKSLLKNLLKHFTVQGRSQEIWKGVRIWKLNIWETPRVFPYSQFLEEITYTQNMPLGSNINSVCIYLAETYTAVYTAYEHNNPTVLLTKLANLYFRIAY